MLHIYCPHCREMREEEEFTYAGEAHIVRPKEPELITDAEWGDYVFFRKNPRGLHHEMWHHSAGCRQYFNATRDTYTYAIYETYKVGQAPQVVENNTQKNLQDKMTTTSHTVTTDTVSSTTHTDNGGDA